MLDIYVFRSTLDHTNGYQIIQVYPATNLSEKVTVLGAGPCHFGGLCGVDGEPAIVVVVDALHIASAGQLVLLIGHVTGPACAWHLPAQPGVHSRCVS